MWPFKKKYKRIEDQEEGSSEEDEQAFQKSEVETASSNSKLSADFTRLKAKFDQFAELRKVFNERFTRINEQVGELRGMIMDTNRTMQDLEIKTVKAVDLVDAVQPDKLMVEVKKQDAKIEAVKANLESNEAMMKTIMNQLKEMRHLVNKFRGVEQIVKLSEDVKKELMEAKKVEATIERHSDKVEGIFIESQKRFQEFEEISDKIKDINKRLGTVTQQSDQNKVKLQNLASKKEVEKLIQKFNDFEKHVGHVVDLLSKRANDLPKDIDHKFSKLEENMNKAFENKLKKAEKTNKILKQIEEKAPDIAAKLRIDEVSRDKQEGKEIDSGKSISDKQEEPKKKSFINKIISKKENKEPEKKEE
ncbi:hypothetical protein GF327_06590 [Candidatus Woesearchaeota archaeon]|nr:hypothetical protein [Candidatus Woesearchaeota archaeon]